MLNNKINPSYDIYNAACPSRQILEMISNKWVILVIDLLAIQSYYFLELKRAIPGVSRKVLTTTLRNLEKNGVIRREVQGETLIKVNYALTPLGISLSKVLAFLTQWSYAHIKEIEAARKEYKQR